MVNIPSLHVAGSELRVLLAVRKILISNEIKNLEPRAQEKNSGLHRAWALEKEKCFGSMLSFQELSFWLRTCFSDA
jgi:hypothetical protein